MHEAVSVNLYIVDAKLPFFSLSFTIFAPQNFKNYSMINEEKIHKSTSGWWALSPLFVFLCLYLVTSILVNDFYKVPITVAFLISSCYAIAITRGLNLEQRVYQFSVGASNKNIMLMVWIFILAGAFAQSAKQMGAIDATVNLTLHILPDNLLLAGIFLVLLLHFAIHRYQCRHYRGSDSCRYRVGRENRNRSALHGSSGSGRLLFR